MSKKKSQILRSPIMMIFIIMVLVTIMTYFIPAGEFTRTVDPVTGITQVDGNSFHYIDKTYIGLMDLFCCIHKGFMNAADIIFMCFFSCFYIRVITESGAFSSGIAALLKKLGAHKHLLLPVMIIILSLAGYSYGETEDLYPLIPLFIAAAVAAGYDPVVGIAISGGAAMIGFANSAFNPYTIGVAQKIAELPLYSGALFRTIIYVIFLAMYIAWVMRYAKKHSGPDRLEGFEGVSIIEINENTEEFTSKHAVILLGLAAIVTMMVVGALKLGWYFTEISALFLIGAIFSCIFLRYSPDKTIGLAVEGFKDIIVGIIIIGLARSILVILDEASVIDTVIYGLYRVLNMLPKAIAPVGMLFIQTLLNLFIPSGSGQAAAVMPIMVPIADLIGINRQVAVLAFQMGDGFSNMIWPTATCSAICGIAKVSLDKWYKFIIPFFAFGFAVQCALIVIANLIPLGPC